MKQDLTQGNILKKLIVYFLPIVAGTIFQQLYNAVDAIIVGKYVGTIALAAVGGSAANIINVLIGFFVALSGGATVIVAQLFGAKEDQNLHIATGTGIAFCLFVGVILTVFGYALAPQMLRWLSTPADTIADATTYLRIFFLGVVAQLLYNMESGILRAVGDSRSPFIYLLICCGVNIVLDLVFVVLFDMSVAGVAIATVISQVLSAMMATIKLLRSKESYRIDLKAIKLSPEMLGKMMKIGVPSGLQASMYSVSNIILQVAVNKLGTVVVAAWSLAGKIDGFFWATSNAAGTAIMNFSAQNYGAGDLKRVKDGIKQSLKLFLAINFGLSIILLTAGMKALPLFTDDMEVVAATQKVMLYIVPFYFTWTFVEIISNALRGVGDAVMPTVICGIGICLLRVIWIATVYRATPNLLVVCLSYPISWTLTDIAFIIYYRHGSWHNQLSTH